jgi:TM2 domain-containing membrane protein YozV
MKDKNTAGLLAIFLGGVGGHKFYLQRTGMGVLYILFCWTLIPAVVALVEGIVLLTMSKEAFDMKFNVGLMALAVAPQNIVVNVSNTAHAGVAAPDVASQLKALHDLKVSGALSEEEYVGQKQKLLSSS